MKTNNNFSDFGKIPPQAIEIEEAVLSAIMIDSSCFIDIENDFHTNLFYKNNNKKIALALQQLYNNSENIDILTVANQLKKNKTLDDIGGAVYLSHLSDKANTSANIAEHLKIIQEKYICRELIRISAEITKKAFDDNTNDPVMLFDYWGRLYAELSTKLFKASNMYHIQDVIRMSLEECRVRMANAKDGVISGIPSGFTDLDKRISGWRNGDLVILAGRAGMGKTAVMLKFIKSAGVPVAVFSLEVTKIKLADRMIIGGSGVDGNKYKNGYLSKNEFERVKIYSSELANSDIYIDDRSGVNVNYIKTNARILHSKGKLGMICIDYLQLTKATEKGQTRDIEIGNITRELKTLAKELEIPIILLAQLSRAVETRGGNKKPQLSDLRESGNIEQDADIVIFAYRPGYYGFTNDEDGNIYQDRQIELITSKFREGSPGTDSAIHNEDLTEFYDISTFDYEQKQVLNPSSVFEEKTNDMPF